MWQFKVQWTNHDASQSYWRVVCVCHDLESVGYIERMFQQLRIDYTVERIIS